MAGGGRADPLSYSGGGPLVSILDPKSRPSDRTSGSKLAPSYVRWPRRRRQASGNAAKAVKAIK
jgi:hypothetical protein